ncbi:metallophosphoesterase [Clostridium sp. YIM B02515]|uniref:Phosphoesterase n=1 Tax=Clostridium rhizosphaerae TaxID=2803861 RepID=A0ABS1T764_9CLOT|nr:metallophosphoesterase [Clostridium rhizosphaerae]
MLNLEVAKIKVGILSDTHISKDNYKIDELLKKYFNEVDIIIHAGDYKSSKVIETIKKYKPFIGVFGNNDGNAVKELVREKEIIKLNGYKIGIYHGHGEGKSTIDKAYEVFKEDKVDIIVFGHSHLPIIKTMNKTLMLNPGSPTSKRKERWYSIIILELDKNFINAQIKFFSNI